MTTQRFADLVTAPDAFISSVIGRLADGRPVRRSVPDGWLHIDRLLPFLFVYRRITGHVVEGVDRLVHSQPSYLTVSEEPDVKDSITALVKAIVECGVDRFGSFLVVELWPATEGSAFRVVSRPAETATTIKILADELVHVDVNGRRAVVETTVSPEPAPAKLEPILSSEDQRRQGALLIGLEVPLFFLDPEGKSFPLVLRRLQRELTGALQRAAFEFTTVQTSFQPEDYRALGRRRLLAASKKADHRLAEVAGAVDHILAVTPMNADAAWKTFREDGFRTEPSFRYRPLGVDPDLLKRSLYGISLEHVDDPTLFALFRAKRRELDRQFSLLEDRDSSDCLQTSLQLYGAVDADLLALAQELLTQLSGTRPTAKSRRGSRPMLGATDIARRANAELDRYRTVDPELAASVSIRDDIPGVMVSDGDLLIGSDARVSADRLEALIEHEIGTHVLTAANGGTQPLQLLRVGLPGYEETQEALALLAEFVSGGLTRQRLETLGARVVAVCCLVDGATFVQTFEELHRTHGLAAGRAFHIAMRVHRSGGLTKDAIYLRGLDRLLRYLAEGNPLDPLLVGKLSLDHIAVIQELQWREVLSPPVLRPHWLDAPTAAERLDEARSGLTVLDLVPEG